MTGTHHHNGLKTAALMGGLWSLLLLVGWLLAQGTGSSVWLFIMPLIGVAQTAYSYWNFDWLAVRFMGVIEVIEAQQPEMHAIVRELYCLGWNAVVLANYIIQQQFGWR